MSMSSDNPVLAAILNRASVRLFSGRALEPETLETLLTAALRAPTTAMGHFYSIIVVADPGLKAALHQACGRQRAMNGSEFLVLCIDLRRSDLWAEHFGARRRMTGYTALIYGTIDMTAAAENLVIAAAGLGLGTCYIGGIGHNAARVCRILALPPGVLPVVGLAVGYPAESPAPRPRIPLRFMVHRDGYRDMTAQEIDAAVLELARPSRRDAGGTADDVLAAARPYISMIEGPFWERGEEHLRAALAGQGLAPVDGGRGGGEHE